MAEAVGMLPEEVLERYTEQDLLRWLAYWKWKGEKEREAADEARAEAEAKARR